MIEIKDRIPTYPGRIKLIPVPGQADTYDLVRADDPIEPGTPINRALFQAFSDDMSAFHQQINNQLSELNQRTSDDINAIRQQVNDKLFEITQRTKLGNLAEGAVFGLYENGVLVPFIKIQTISSTKRILVVRKNCVKKDVLVTADAPAYDNGKTDTWLNNEYLATLDSATQSVLVQHQFNVTTNSVTTIYRKIFLLSATEYGLANGQGYSTLGTAISYLSTADRRISYFNGAPINHWTRSNNLSNGQASYITTTGAFASGTQTTMVAGIRPAFTLPEDFEVLAGDPSTANTMASAGV